MGDRVDSPVSLAPLSCESVFSAGPKEFRGRMFRFPVAFTLIARGVSPQAAFPPGSKAWHEPDQDIPGSPNRPIGGWLGRGARMFISGPPRVGTPSRPPASTPAPRRYFFATSAWRCCLYFAWTSLRSSAKRWRTLSSSVFSWSASCLSSAVS